MTADTPAGTILLLGAAHPHTPDHIAAASAQGWRIGWIHDRDPGRAARTAKDAGARVVADPAEAAQADAAFVCSQTAHHAADIRAAFAAGLPVFCEKPLAHDAATARALAAEARGRILETGFFLRSYPALAELRDRLREGQIGAPVEVRARFAHDGGFARWLDLTGWMSDPVLAGYGGFGDEAVHVLDWLLWTFGPVDGGAARLGRTLGLGTDDGGAAVMSFASGAVATVSGGWTDTRMRLEIEVTATAGGAAVQDGGVRLWRRDGTGIWSARMEDLDAGRGSRAFLRRLESGGDPLVPPEEAACANTILDLLYGR